MNLLKLIVYLFLCNYYYQFINLIIHYHLFLKNNVQYSSFIVWRLLIKIFRDIHIYNSKVQSGCDLVGGSAHLAQLRGHGFCVARNEHHSFHFLAFPANTTPFTSLLFLQTQPLSPPCFSCEHLPLHPRALPALRLRFA